MGNVTCSTNLYVQCTFYYEGELQQEKYTLHVHCSKNEKRKKNSAKKNSEAQFTSQTLQKCHLFEIRKLKMLIFDTRILHFFSNYKPLWHYKDHI